MKKMITITTAVALAGLMLAGCMNVNVNVKTGDKESDAVETAETPETPEEEGSTETAETNEENTIFDITMPEELEGTYVIESMKNAYYV